MVSAFYEPGCSLLRLGIFCGSEANVLSMTKPNRKTHLAQYEDDSVVAPRFELAKEMHFAGLLCKPLLIRVYLCRRAF